ncbi:MAG: hypothetical protein ACP5Q0_02335 [Halothiobacillus sp.]
MQQPASQICAAHIELITAVADSRRAGHLYPAAQSQIEQYQNTGWVQLAHTLTAWMNGAEPDLARLDAEDQQIILGIEYATTEPNWLETLSDQAQTEAAQSLAQMIYAATWGDYDALELLSSMREAAEDAGVYQSAAHAFVAMVEGERDNEKLHQQYPKAEQSLINAVLNCLIEKEQD